MAGLVISLDQYHSSFSFVPDTSNMITPEFSTLVKTYITAVCMHHKCIQFTVIHSDFKVIENDMI